MSNFHVDWMEMLTGNRDAQLTACLISLGIECTICTSLENWLTWLGSLKMSAARSGVQFVHCVWSACGGRDVHQRTASLISRHWVYNVYTTWTLSECTTWASNKLWVYSLCIKRTWLTWNWFLVCSKDCWSILVSTWFKHTNQLLASLICKW